MKKKYLLGLVIIGLVLILTGCSKKYNIDGISMIIKEGTLTNTKATIVITDTTGKNNTYGEDFSIEKKVGFIWKKLKCDNCWFNAIGYMVDENNQLELEHNWENMYGRLKKGTYRLVKSVNDQKIAVEFEIK